MCGIAGMTGDCLSVTPIESMTAAMVHRGPDDGGIWQSIDGRCVLGNRRLAIIDVSQSGHMPMSTPDGRYTITFNGEIYNFKQLRAELESRGVVFSSQGDTEVVLELFAAEGPESFRRLNGIFALAIWDALERTLHLARDRFGIKPLYWTHGDGKFIFASEVRAILASNLVPRRADPTGIASFLTLGSVADSQTIVEGVHCLPPASYAVMQEGRFDHRQYWIHEEELRSIPELPADEAGEAVFEGLKAAVVRQMVSDVPLGLFLSSGLDSSLLAAVMRAVDVDAIRTVTVSFDEDRYDEGVRARRLAAFYNTDHVECRITSADVLTGLDRAVGSLDQPSTDGINTYFVSKAASESGLTVALSGLGADELFGGYTSFRVAGRLMTFLEAAERLPTLRLAALGLSRSPALAYRWRRALGWMGESPDVLGAYLGVRALLSPQDTECIATKSSFDPPSYLRGLLDGSELSPMVAISALESRAYMQNQLLRDTDTMSMAHSLEVRVPYLDNEMVSLAAAARAVLGTSPKAAMAEVARRHLPLHDGRRRKQGFTFPFALWLRGPMAPTVEAAARTDSILLPGMLERWRAEFIAGRRHWTHIWAPLVLDRWLSLNDVEVPHVHAVSPPLLRGREVASAGEWLPSLASRSAS
ncbi:MAG TPA: asparagine synthase (glutamine-hydrolyzing) [Chloroflexota bacterium]|nr:asparagine synthase (glutamine-hydrolyzing) [Chloroflexota bacterium]